MNGPERPLNVADELPARPNPSRWRGVLWWLGGALLLAVVVLVSVYSYYQAVSARQLRNYIAELDENDPGWRLEEIEERRPKLPDKHNSARVILELNRMLGRSWPDPKFDEQMQDIVPPHLLDPARMSILEKEMRRVESVRLAAKPLADMPLGSNEIRYAFNPIATLLTEVQETRRIASFLRYDMLYRSNKGDVSGAVRSGRACICAGRSLNDDPFIISQLVRVAIVTIGLHGVEAALSLGEASDDELVALGKLLGAEERHNTLLVGIRGERATMYQLFSRMGSGAIPTQDMAMMGEGDSAWVAQWFIYPRWQFRRQQPIMMETMTRAVEIARKPTLEQTELQMKLEEDVRAARTSAPLVAMFVPAMHKFVEACHRKSATVAAMRTLLAVERYRMKKGKMPDKLAELVPEYLQAVPQDPYDGKPLRMARFAEGVVVYSVGPDKTDDGGKIDRKNPTGKGTDLGYRLWDLPRRRQPAAPWKPEEKQP